MLDEASLFKEIKLAVSERFASPLIGTYSVSWAIWNFKFFLIVFSSEQINSKLMLIHDEMFSEPIKYLWVFGGPAVMTALYIVAYPYPAQIVYEFRLKFQRKLNQIKQKEEDEELLSAADSRKLRLEIREKEREFNRRLDEAEKEISDLRRENESLKTSSRKFTTSSGDMGINDNDASGAASKEVKLKKADPFQSIEGLSTEEVAIIKILSEFVPSAINELTILQNVFQRISETGRKTNRPKIRQALQLLLGKRLVASDGRLSDENYSLSKKGEELCRKYNL